MGMLWLVVNQPVWGQLKKADQLFDQFRFSEAATQYEKVLKKNDSNLAALQGLAYCYKQLGEFTLSEEYYSQAVQYDSVSSSTFLYYGQVLKRNEKPAQARTQFKRFVELEPNSFIGRILMQSCDVLEEWAFTPPLYSIQNLKNINTKHSEFSAVPYKQGVAFTTDRGEELINESLEGWASQPYLSLYYAPYDTEDSLNIAFKKAKQVPGRINSDFHDGPATFGDAEKVVYFTRVEQGERGREYVNRLHIYSAVIKKKRVGKVVPFFLNSDDYSVGHPFLTPDGNRLFFASDMPGGQGGMDIYYCNREGQVWGTPINLGPTVNTIGNEIFPTGKSSTELHFSSDLHPGYGGMDIFFTRYIDGKWEVPVNMKAPLNTPADDFGLTYISDSAGFFSSNRDGGRGKDDLYGFTKLPEYEGDLITISGIFQREDTIFGNRMIQLLDEKGNVVQTVKTDEFGQFSFYNLAPDRNYLVSLAEQDTVHQDLSVYLFNEKGEKVLLAEKVKSGVFKFEALNEEAMAELEVIDETEPTADKFKIFGQLYKALPGDYETGMEVIAYDENGDVVAVAFTDENGRFVFEKLDPDESYLIKVREDDPDFKMIVFDEEGDPQELGLLNNQGNFEFKRLSEDDNIMALVAADDRSKAITGIFEYEGLPADQITIKLVDENDSVVAVILTDENGRFTFENLPPDHNYMVVLDDNDSSVVADLKMFFTNQDGEKVLLADRAKSGDFSFKTLSKQEAAVLTLLAEPEEEKPFKIFGQIYKTLPGDYTEGMEIYAVNDSGDIIAVAITDAQGNFEFAALPADQNYLFRLAEDDPEANISIIKQEETESDISYKQGEFDYNTLSQYQNLMTLLNETDSKADLDSIPVDIPPLGPNDTLVSEIENVAPDQDTLLKSVSGDDFVTYNVYYDFGSWDVKEEDTDYLDRIATYLTENPGLDLIITSHSDTWGSKNYNMILSKRRTKSILRYLIKQGIDANRLKGIWLGETETANRCGNGVWCPPSERAKNRRTEFKITR